MPVRNGATFIAEAISSALVQLGDTDEIVVVDDASSDDTRLIVTAIRDARVRMLAGLGRGVSAARNVGLAAVSNEFVAFLDHDDVWPQSRHEVMLAALADDPKMDALFGRIRVRFEQGARLSPRYLAIDGKLQVGSICTGLFRRRILVRISGFAENMRFGEDVDYYMRLIEAGMKFGLCHIDSLIYRRHQTNSTNDQTAALDGFSDMLRRKIVRARVRNAGATECASRS
jgi:glycosyltransferase involved in cell wall biosynthesis